MSNQTPMEKEIAKHCRMLAQNAPDVLEGDEDETDVFDFWMGLFKRYAEEKVAEVSSAALADQIKADAVAARDEALKKIRDTFQIRSPHYTPPPGADVATWKSWVLWNAAVHGEDGEYGCRRRFPEHAEILRRLPVAHISEHTAALLEHASYRRRP